MADRKLLLEFVTTVVMESVITIEVSNFVDNYDHLVSEEYYEK